MLFTSSDIGSSLTDVRFKYIGMGKGNGKGGEDRLVLQIKISWKTGCRLHNLYMYRLYISELQCVKIYYDYYLHSYYFHSSPILKWERNRISVISVSTEV